MSSSLNIPAEQFDAELDRAWQRLDDPIDYSQAPFVGWVDPPPAQELLQWVHGTPATATNAIVRRIQTLQLEAIVTRMVNGEEEIQPVPQHPLQALLDNPTKLDTGELHTIKQLMLLIGNHLLNVGEAYLLIVQDGLNVPRGLFPMKAGRVAPIVRGGVVTEYVTFGSNGEKIPIPSESVIRIWDPDPDDFYRPRGVLSKHVLTASSQSYLKQHVNKFYQNDATPKVVMETTNLDAVMPDGDQKRSFIADWVQRMHRRLGRNVGVPKMGPPGWRFRELKSHDENPSIVALWKHTVEQLLMDYGVPASIVGAVVDVNRAAAETNHFVFDRNTILPYTELIAEGLSKGLAPFYPVADGLTLGCRFRPFIDPDKEYLLKQEEQDLRNKVRSPNEVRGGRPAPLPDATWGDLPVGTFNEVPYTGEEPEPIELEGLGPDVPAEPEDERTTSAGRGRSEPRSLEALRAYFSQQLAWDRQLRREQQYQPLFASRTRSAFTVQERETLKRYAALTPRARISVADIFNPREWTDLFRRVIEPVRRRAYVDTGNETTQAIVQQTFDLTKRGAAILREQGQVFYVFSNETTQRELQRFLSDAEAAGLGSDEIARGISDTFGRRRDSARRIARTEIATATQAAQLEGYEQTGVVERKRWNTSLDTTVRDSHLIEGQTRELGEDFVLQSGQRAAGPAALGLPPEDRINCRCFVTPVFAGEE